jgi:hypothetical protein
MINRLLVLTINTGLAYDGPFALLTLLQCDNATVNSGWGPPLGSMDRTVSPSNYRQSTKMN